MVSEDLSGGEMVEDAGSIMSVAKKFLDKNGQTEIEISLTREGPQVAIWALLQAIQDNLQSGKINAELAHLLYSEIRLSPKNYQVN